jgi:CDP-glucose 4,6-dehydratase
MGCKLQPGFWQGRPALVTGASGLLGGWMVRTLLEEGADVVALIRDGAPNSLLFREGWIDRVTTVNGSLADAGLLRRTLAEYSIDTVFHLAAQTLVGVAKTDPVGTLEANVQGTWNLLEATRQCNTRQVIVASSDKAYGASNNLPYLETHPLQGTYPYDVSKSCVDLISSMYAATYGLPVGIVRCGNLFGGGDLNFSRTVPGLIQSTLRNERFQIRSDGKFVRDFLYVEDAVWAYLCLAERMASDRSLAGEALNFSLEVRYTVLELVRMVLEQMQRTDLAPVIQNIASSEIREQYMSSQKARERLGWAPRYGMQEGLSRTINWYTQYFQSIAAPNPMAHVASAD